VISATFEEFLLHSERRTHNLASEGNNNSFNYKPDGVGTIVGALFNGRLVQLFGIKHISFI
jgi:hypothetical protein